MQNCSDQTVPKQFLLFVTFDVNKTNKKCYNVVMRNTERVGHPDIIAERRQF